MNKEQFIKDNALQIYELMKEMVMHHEATANFDARSMIFKRGRGLIDLLELEEELEEEELEEEELEEEMITMDTAFIKTLSKTLGKKF